MHKPIWGKRAECHGVSQLGVLIFHRVSNKRKSIQWFPGCALCKSGPASFLYGHMHAYPPSHLKWYENTPPPRRAQGQEVRSVLEAIQISWGGWVTASQTQPNPPSYMHSALIMKTQEWDTFKLIIWDTGSGDIDVLFLKDEMPTMYGLQHQYSTAEELFLSLWSEK